MRSGRIRIVEQRESSVRIPDLILKCVGYVCEVTHRDATGAYGDPYATGFFIAIPCESPELREMRMNYFVTAKHVAQQLTDRPIYFSVNKHGGGVVQQIGVGNWWWTHPQDVNADVAITLVGVNPAADIIPVAIETIGLPARLSAMNVGIGDEVFALGLFSAVPGNHSNMPIVRCGNIAMMPTEQVQTELGYTDVYLVEARSIGGMSGSPVFVIPTLNQKVKRQVDGAIVPAFFSGTGETLLGMVQGHWDIREEDINKPSFTHDRKRGVNYGIAVVVPAFKLYETVYQPELVAHRKRLEEDILRRNIPGSDSARPSDKKPTFTKADFEAALSKATQKTTPKK